MMEPIGKPDAQKVPVEIPRLITHNWEYSRHIKIILPDGSDLCRKYAVMSFNQDTQVAEFYEKEAVGKSGGYKLNMLDLKSETFLGAKVILDINE